jgi:hypothetical protein
LANTPLQAMMYVQSLSTGGTIFWKELHSTITTNDFGLFTLVIGTGTRQIESTVATFDLIDWSVTPKYLKTQIYYDGSWKDMGTSQLWSVPYALKSKESEQWTTSGANIYRATGNVGIGTSSPAAMFHVTGNSRMNNSMVGDGIELQQYATGNRYSGIDFHGDDTYTDYALRIIRYNSGPDAASSIVHRGLGELQLWTQDAAPISFYTTNNQRMTIAANGKIGIGTNSPNSVLNPYMTIGDGLNNTAEIMNLTVKTTTNVDYLRFYGIRKVAGNTWGDVSLRIQQRVDATDMGYIEFNPGTAGYDLAFGTNNIERLRINYNGNVGIGTTTPTSKMVIRADDGWDDSTPLFEVKNKTGVPIFAVYNNGVRILVDNTNSKAIKGGFAVGGYDMTKAGKTVDFMTISPDSIRFNINNDNVKGKKGGFAVGGYDLTKKGPINQDFMYITPQTSDNGQYNTFLGYKAGIVTTTGKENVMLGYNSGIKNTTGSQNVFIGKNAGIYNRTGSNNVILGWSDIVAYPFLDPGNLGSLNTLIGYATGMAVTGTENSVMGSTAGIHLLTGSYNSIFGSNAGFNSTTGSENVLIGNSAGYGLTTGSYNVMIGTQAGAENITGNYNVFIGESAGWNETGSNKLIIAGGSGNTKLITGDFSTGYVGIGTTSSGYKLQVGAAGDGSQARANAWNLLSDIRLKTDLAIIADPLGIITCLRGFFFNWNIGTDKSRQLGLSAQDVEKVLPEIVSQGSDGYLSVEYSKLTPVLIEAIKEQQHQIESTKQENQQLKSELQSLKDKMDRIEAMLAKGDIR